MCLLQNFEPSSNLHKLPRASFPFQIVSNFGFLIDALEVMPSSINPSNGPLIGAALEITECFYFGHLFLPFNIPVLDILLILV